MIYLRQREVILKALYNSTNHPTAEELYNQLKPQYPSLSLTTVCRNLNRLAASGMAHKIEVGKGADRYDGNLHNHYHMVCQKCGKITDLPADFVPELNYNTIKGMGIQIEHSHVMFYGLCANCNVAQATAVPV